MISLASIIERFEADYLAQYPRCALHIQRLVPGSYFLITFTLPAELRPLAWQHQRIFYAALMGCAWATLHAFSQNHKQLQGSPGAVAVLHTHWFAAAERSCTKVGG